MPFTVPAKLTSFFFGIPISFPKQHAEPIPNLAQIELSGQSPLWYQ